MINDTTNTPTNEIPYGYCHCGCGQKTPVCTHTRIKDGLQKGEPTRFIRGHGGRVKRENLGRKPKPAYTAEYAPWVAMHGLLHPYGECQCGCGNQAPVAKHDDNRTGLVKGHPCRFYNKHHIGKPREQTFWERVNQPSPDACWEWQGKITEDGYGSAGYKGKSALAHRVAWILTHGEIPQGMYICHKCDTPACCNPAHLFVGTQGDNIRDMFAKGRGNPGGHVKKKHA